MILLLTFAFVGGVATVLSPCILPVLPVVLASALGSSRWRPLGVVLGLVASFAFFTLALTTLVSALDVSADALRLGGAVVIGLFGLVMVVPALQHRFEQLGSRIAGLGGGGSTSQGFGSGILVGASLGLVWAPCAGPILASITTLVATNRVSPEAVAITISYALGAGVPMLAIAYGGRRVVSRFRLLNQHTASLQRAFGVVMVAFALTFFLGIDRTVQAALVEGVPVEYSRAITSLEDQPGVKEAIDRLRANPRAAGQTGSPQGTEVAPPETSGPAAMVEPPASDPSQSTPAGAPEPAAPRPTLDLPDLGMAPELRGIAGWINGEPTTIASLRGKVVLVDFWTYSCINCIRTLPYLTQWDDRYRDAGLVILGIHTPEFEFEKSRDNVARAVQQYGIKYLVAQDNGFATWEAFDNRYWPAKYLIDANGRVRYTHFGEGEYQKTEEVIQSLLAEAGAALSATAPPMPEYSLAGGRTPELYLGADRQTQLASPERFTVGRPRQFSLPDQLPRDHFALQGEWTVEGEHAVAGQGSRLDLRFYADKVYLVLTPGDEGEEVEVLLDGLPVADSEAGADVRDGSMRITESRLYQLIDLRGEFGQHMLTLNFRKGGTSAYAFTFG